MPGGKLLVILDSLIFLVYKPEEHSPSISKARPELRAASAAPGLCLGVREKGFHHRLPFDILGLFFGPAWASSAALCAFC